MRMTDTMEEEKQRLREAVVMVMISRSWDPAPWGLHAQWESACLSLSSALCPYPCCTLSPSETEKSFFFFKRVSLKI